MHPRALAERRGVALSKMGTTAHNMADIFDDEELRLLANKIQKTVAPSQEVGALLRLEAIAEFMERVENFLLVPHKIEGRLEEVELDGLPGSGEQVLQVEEPVDGATLPPVIPLVPEHQGGSPAPKRRGK